MMMRTTTLLVLFAFYSLGVAEEETGCDQATHLTGDLQSDDFDVKFSATESKCLWTILGDLDCNVALDCQINIPKTDDDCGDDFLKISDGSKSSQKYCGEEHLKNIVPAEGLRNLFAVFQTSGSISDKKYTGVKCTAQCVDPKKHLDHKTTLPSMERKTDTRCVCGLQNKDDRIVGGEDAKKFEFPWQAAIVQNATRLPTCGGALINDRFVLTATHCFFFDGTQAGDIEVLLHAHVLDQSQKQGAVDVKLGKANSIRSSGYKLAHVSDADENTQRFKVEEIIMHPFFTDRFDYDYALLKLDRKIKLNDADAPTPVCLPSEDTWDSKDFRGKNLIVVGWGLADEIGGGTTRVLQKLDVPYVPSETCSAEDWYGDFITQRMLCAGYENGEKDACTGDSGGPLLYREKKQFFQYGVVSYGEGCARKKRPGVYSKVTEMMQWIHFHTSEEDAKWCALK